MGIDNQSTWNQNCVCLPCTENENYAHLDASEQVHAQWDDYKNELKSFGLYRENLINLIGKEMKDKQKNLVILIFYALTIAVDFSELTIVLISQIVVIIPFR